MGGLKYKFADSEQTEKSLQHSIKDGIYYAAMTGACDNYFSAFAVFLKMSTPQIAWLASIPTLLASFGQLFSVWLGQTTGVRKGIIVVGALVQVAALAAIALGTSYLGDYAFPVMILSMTVYFLGPHLGAPLFGSLMGALVPDNQRGRFFALRTRLSSVSSFSMLIVAGMTIQIFDIYEMTYRGFLVVFFIGGLSRLMSAWHIKQMHDPLHGHAVQGDVVSLFGRRFFKDQGRLLRFSLFNALMQGTVALSGPFVVVYLLNVLHFSYIELTANSAASILIQFLVLNRWGRLADLFGNRIILRLTGYTIPVIPLLWVLSTDYWYLLFVQMLSGLVWSGFTLSASNFVYDLTTPDKRAGLMAIHNVVNSIAIFVGASIGAYLAITLPHSAVLFDIEFNWGTALYNLFVISAISRCIVALIFLPKLQEVRSVRSMSYSGLIFRVTRFNPITGVAFDIVARRRRSEMENKESDE